MFIKIIRESIKENSRVGETNTLIPGKQQVDFKCSKLPETLKRNRHRCFIKSSHNSDIEGVIDISVINELTEKDFIDNDLSISVTREIQKVYHDPIQKYTYEYEDPEVVCCSCRKKVKLSQLIDECFCVDEPLIKRCPLCEYPFTETLDYERIEDVILDWDTKEARGCCKKVEMRFDTPDAYIRFLNAYTDIEDGFGMIMDTTTNNTERVDVSGVEDLLKEFSCSDAFKSTFMEQLRKKT